MKAPLIGRDDPTVPPMAMLYYVDGQPLHWSNTPIKELHAAVRAFLWDHELNAADLDIIKQYLLYAIDAPAYMLFGLAGAGGIVRAIQPQTVREALRYIIVEITDYRTLASAHTILMRLGIMTLTKP